MLYTPYRRPIKPIHSGFEESVTEQAHISVSQQLEWMMHAGEILKEARQNQFDFKPGDLDDGRNEPLRRPGIDMSEVTELNADATERIKKATEKKEADDEAAELLKKQNAQNQEAEKNKKRTRKTDRDNVLSQREDDV